MENEANNSVLVTTVNEVVKESPAAKESLSDMVDRVSKRFIENKLDDFPRMCDVFRVQNILKARKLSEDGTEGWSDSKSFKWDFEIPTDLYYFMVNLVYRNFWEEDNEKVWRPFLRALMRGDDPMSTLMKVKAIYGSTIEAEKAGIV